jgi:hypothetical protein
MKPLFPMTPAPPVHSMVAWPSLCEAPPDPALLHTRCQCSGCWLDQVLIRPGPGIFDAPSLGHANEEESAVHQAVAMVVCVVIRVPC